MNGRSSRTALALALIALAPACRTARPPTEGLRFPPLRAVEAPRVLHRTLPNGLRLLLVKDRELPTIDVRVLVGAGSIADPPEKVGLAEITAEVMRTGGTETLPGDALDAELERLAADLEIGADLDVTTASLSLLAEDVDRGLAILADVLAHPAFPQAKIELALLRMRTRIARRNDDPDGIAQREFRAAVYGRESPYARWPEYATIGAIGRPDLVAFHARRFGPRNAVLGAWGDFDPEAMARRIEDAVGGWRAAGSEPLARPDIPHDGKPAVLLVRRPDVNQSSIRIGHIGGRMDDPDYPALAVLTAVLGWDRLYKEVREARGLAYAVSGHYGVEYLHPGIFDVSCQTRSEKTVEAIRVILQEIRRITAEPVTEEELERAKDAFRSRWAFLFETKARLVGRILRYAYYGYPEDFSQRTLRAIDGVTAEDVLRVARAHLRPDALRILVVGNPDAFDEPLSALGPVRKVDVSIPPPAPAKGEGPEKKE